MTEEIKGLEEIRVYVDGLGEVYIERGSSLEDLAEKVFEESYKNYFGARISNEIFHMTKVLEEDMYIKFLDIESRDGFRIYTRTITGVFVVACKELYPDRKVRIDYSIGSGLYAEFDGSEKIEYGDIMAIRKEMTRIIEEDLPIDRVKYPADEAMELFESHGHQDKVRLYRTLDREEIQIYRIGAHLDGFYGFLAPSTGYVEKFDLKFYYPGALILYPNRFSGGRVPVYKEQKQLAKVFSQATDWANMMDLGYVASLNEKVEAGEMDEVIMAAEIMHERQFARIADAINSDDDIRIILIAGPSSSGKTSFSKRLTSHLNVLGKRPIAISADDYFVDRDKTPVNEEGELDFEALEAIDLDLFNRDLIALLQGEEVELPKFNFKLGRSEKSGRVIRVDKDHPIIVEGIHGLNPRLASYIPEKNKYKIYISALTQLNLDAHNRISTRDTRFLRRMVRDVQFRGNDVFRTFDLWENVTKGEDRNIFPYQEEADIMFDTALVYELNIMRKYALPLLEKVDNRSEHYAEAKRLANFLKYFKPMDQTDTIPPNSLLREFIGGTSLDVH